MQTAVSKFPNARHARLFELIRQQDLATARSAVAARQTADQNEAQTQALSLLKTANEDGAFNDVPFDTVWSLLKATAKAAIDVRPMVKKMLSFVITFHLQSN